MEHEDIQEELLRGRVLDIETGVRLQLQVGPKDARLKLSGTLIGMSPEEFLIVAIPEIAGVLARLSELSPVTVRYVFCGGVYGFTSSILSCIHKPKLMLFMSYPHSVDVIDLRKTKRMLSLLPASAIIQHKNFTGVLVDMSEGGCRLSLDTESEGLPFIYSGEEISISLQLTGTAIPRIIRGSVQHIRHDGKFAEMGIKFKEDDSDSMIGIRNYVAGVLNLPERVA